MKGKLQLKKYQLKIDTSRSVQTVVRLKGKTFKAPQGRSSQMLLPLILKALEETKLTWQDIGGIRVVPGPGSFTGLRVGFSVANTLGWALDIPVNGSRSPQAPVYESPVVKKSVNG